MNKRRRYKAKRRRWLKKNWGKLSLFFDTYKLDYMLVSKHEQLDVRRDLVWDKHES